MPVVEFGQDDLLAGKIVPPAWYRMTIKSVGEKPSKDQQSTNYPVTGIIQKDADSGDASLSGVPITWMFNSKAKGFMIGFLESLGYTPEAGKRVDLAAAEGKEIEVYVENDTYEGRLVNRVNHKYRKAQ